MRGATTERGAAKDTRGTEMSKNKRCEIKEYLEDGYVLTWCGSKVYLAGSESGIPESSQGEPCEECKSEMEKADA